MLRTSSNSFYDITVIVLKTLVNCARFPWLRPRIIEEGAIGQFASILNIINSRTKVFSAGTGASAGIKLPAMRENTLSSTLHNTPFTTIAFYISTVIRSLSESKKCRMDLISKGILDLLKNLLPYCDKPSELLISITVYNFMKIVHTFPAVIFGEAVYIITDVLKRAVIEDVAMKQYCSYCIQV